MKKSTQNARAYICLVKLSEEKTLWRNLHRMLTKLESSIVTLDIQKLAEGEKESKPTLTIFQQSVLERNILEFPVKCTKKPA